MQLSPLHQWGKFELKLTRLATTSRSHVAFNDRSNSIIIRNEVTIFWPIETQPHGLASVVDHVKKSPHLVWSPRNDGEYVEFESLSVKLVGRQSRTVVLCVYRAPGPVSSTSIDQLSDLCDQQLHAPLQVYCSRRRGVRRNFHWRGPRGGGVWGGAVPLARKIFLFNDGNGAF